MEDTKVELRKKRKRGGKKNKKKKGQSNEESSNQNDVIRPESNQGRSVANSGGEDVKKVSVLDSDRSKAQRSLQSSSLLEKMRAKLSGGHFRMLNEALLLHYHTGYQEQMLHWPEQPVNIIMKWLKSKSPSLVVADFGCGDARLAKNGKSKVFSFDLVAHDPAVTARDMSNTPLESSSIDAAVFSLSLMGINYQSYITEANRVLEPGGWLLIAEVKSRFDPRNGGANPKAFMKAVCELGFTSELKDFTNKMFILLYFKKKEKQTSDPTQNQWPELKPSLYKRR